MNTSLICNLFLSEYCQCTKVSDNTYCTSYRMIYFLYEVNCCFLIILLHKYLILCFFTSYSSSILIAACLRQIDMSHAKECVLLGTQFENLVILRVNNAST